jgi:hypothetical protein
VLAPVAAAAAVVVFAVALVIVRNLPNGSVASAPPAAGSSSPAAAPAAAGQGIPGYYVAWMQAKQPYLIVGSTFTGKRIATFTAPAGVRFQGVYGAAADRTFIVTGTRLPGHGSGTAWYRLNIAPGTDAPARLDTLSVPVSQSPVGVALSPDGTEVAVALPGRSETVRVYSVATGALVRQWSAPPTGGLSAGKAPAGGWQYTALLLRWSADGRQLAFTWNAAEFRELAATAPSGNLLTASRLIGGIGTGYATLGSSTCLAAQGWQLITIPQGAAAGEGTVCAGYAQTYTRPVRNSVGFLRSTKNSQGGGYWGLDSGSGCPSVTPPDNGAYLGWANADGSVVIGSEVCGGHARFGVFSGSKFTPLPALPHSVPVPDGVMDGTIAW